MKTPRLVLYESKHFFFLLFVHEGSKRGKKVPPHSDDSLFDEGTDQTVLVCVCVALV